MTQWPSKVATKRPLSCTYICSPRISQKRTGGHLHDIIDQEQLPVMALEVDENTSPLQLISEVCSTQMLGMKIELGGQGQIVKIDESLFRHKPKVCTPQNCQFKSHAYNYI